MKVKGQMRKTLSALLCLCMLFTSFGATLAPTAEAAEACEHHPEHTEACGYAAAVEGVDCNHEHDESCGFVEAKEEVACDKGCQTLGENGQIVHVEGCAYSPAVEGQSCTHEHDEICGYVAAVEGKPCQFVCDICGAKAAETSGGAVVFATLPENDHALTGFTSANDNGNIEISKVNISVEEENLILVFSELTHKQENQQVYYIEIDFQVNYGISGNTYSASGNGNSSGKLKKDYQELDGTSVQTTGNPIESVTVTMPLSMISKRAFSLKFGENEIPYTQISGFEHWLDDVPEDALWPLNGNEMSDPVTLLAGSNNYDLRGSTLPETIQKYRNVFLMGVAADFCVFLQKDFTVTQSDAEGRVAVGGNITNKTGWNYVSGAGDYENKTPLDSLLKDRLGAATIILGGEVKNNALGDVHYNSESTRKLVLNQEPPLSPGYSLENIPASDGEKLDQTQTYVTKLFDFEDSFTYLKSASQEIADLAKLSASVRDHKNKIEYDPGTRTITFTYGGKSTDIRESVYFNLSGEAVENFSNARFVKYENIPLFSTEGREVVTNTGGSTTWYYSYIIVNVEGTGTIRLSPADTSQKIDGTKFTTISGSKGEKNISNVNGNNNNDPGVTSLLYNFNEASMVVLGAGNFQGTVFAPGAAVKDEASLQGDDKTEPRGHLSGALIAQSFIGATEFGYRPFSGPFGVISGSLEVSKTVSIDGQSPDSSEPFTFTVTINNYNLKDGDYGDVEFKDNTATFTLKHGESVLITDLPVGVQYTVTESGYDGYEVSVNGVISADASITGTIPVGKKAEAKFTNTKTTSTTDGNLQVRKTALKDGAAVTGSDLNTEFKFKITITEGNVPDGTYGDMTFTNNVAEFTLKHRDVKTATKLPAGVKYTIEETDSKGYTSTSTGNTSGTITAGQTSTADFTNTLTTTTVEETGSLSVRKIAQKDGKDVTGNDLNTEFKFKITITEGNVPDGTYGDMTFTNGVAEFTLKHRDVKTATKLPAGVKYTIEETDSKGYTSKVTTGNTSGTISANSPASVVFTNTLNTTQELDPGILEVSKKVVDGNGKEIADDQTSFTFTVTLTGSYTDNEGTKDASEFNKILDNVTFTNGVATFTLKNGQAKKITGLPAGLRYTVTETKHDGYTSSSTGESGTITATGAAKAAFINTYGAPGSLIVSKSVRGSDGDTTKEFTFTVTLGNTGINGTYGDMTFTNGVATFKLKHGQSKTATGLPAGTTYTVKESDNDGYTVSSTGETGKISATGAVTAAFVNTKGRVPRTGDEANAGLWLALGGVALAGIIASSVFVLKKKKRSN